MSLGFWFRGIFLPFVSWSVTEVLARFGLLVWFQHTDRRHKLLKLTRELLIQSCYTPAANPSGKAFYVTGQSKAMIQWQGRWPESIDLCWHRTGTWTAVPLCPGLPPVINILGLIKLRPLLPQRDNPCWDQSALVIRAKLSTIRSKFWL